MRNSLESSADTREILLFELYPVLSSNSIRQFYLSAIFFSIIASLCANPHCMPPHRKSATNLIHLTVCRSICIAANTLQICLRHASPFASVDALVLQIHNLPRKFTVVLDHASLFRSCTTAASSRFTTGTSEAHTQRD